MPRKRTNKGENLLLYKIPSKKKNILQITSKDDILFCGVILSYRQRWISSCNDLFACHLLNLLQFSGEIFSFYFSSRDANLKAINSFKIAKINIFFTFFMHMYIYTAVWWHTFISTLNSILQFAGSNFTAFLTRSRLLSLLN